MTRIDPSLEGGGPDPTQPKQPDKSLGDLFGDLSSEFSELVQTQLALAKTELRSEAQKAGRTAGMFGAAGFAGYMALLLLSFALAWTLENVMDAGLAFLIVGAIYAVVGAVLYFRARDRARDIDMIPRDTVASLKEDVQWAQQKLS